MGNDKISRSETAVLIPIEFFPHLSLFICRKIYQQLNSSGQCHRGFFHFKEVFQKCFDFVNVDMHTEIPDVLPFQVI